MGWVRAGCGVRARGRGPADIPGRELGQEGSPDRARGPDENYRRTFPRKDPPGVITFPMWPQGPSTLSEKCIFQQIIPQPVVLKTALVYQKHSKQGVEGNDTHSGSAVGSR